MASAELVMCSTAAQTKMLPLNRYDQAAIPVLSVIIGVVNAPPKEVPIGPPPKPKVRNARHC